MLTSDLFHLDAWNVFQITQMLLIAKMLALSEKYRAYSRSRLYTIC